MSCSIYVKLFPATLTFFILHNDAWKHFLLLLVYHTGQGQTLHASAPPPALIAFRCHGNRWKTCPFRTEGTTSHTFFSINEQRCLRHHVTCSSSNLVYMIQCHKYNVQYIGGMLATDLVSTYVQSKKPSQNNHRFRSRYPSCPLYGQHRTSSFLTHHLK